MDFRDVVEQRRSIRTFFPKPIPMEHVATLITAAIHAPSVGDLQPWKFIVVTKPRVIQSIADACPYERWLYQAPLVIVVCSLQEKADVYYPGKGRLWATQSCAAAAENMLLGAVDLGMAGCWVSSFETAKLRSTLHVPEGIDPEIILAFGYADEEAQKKTYQPFDSYVYFNDFGVSNVDWALIKKDIGLYVRGRYDDAKTRAAYESAERGNLRMKIDAFQDKIKNVFKKKPAEEHGHSHPHQQHYHKHHEYTYSDMEPNSGHDHGDSKGPGWDHHGYDQGVHHGSDKDRPAPQRPSRRDPPKYDDLDDNQPRHDH
jgi:nitroreductase